MYSIFRKYIDYPDSYNLGAENDIYLFETEAESKDVLDICFDNGEIIDDMRYGLCRYYIDEYTPRYIPIIY